jgi:hypothetical protein
VSTFPVLKTGAVAQFPASRGVSFATEAIQFLDGTEQRFRDYSRPYHSWIIRLSFLDDTELQNMRAFIQHNGPAGLFSFIDPWDQTVYPNCRIDGVAAVDVLNGPIQAAASVTIRETNT